MIASNLHWSQTSPGDLYICKLYIGDRTLKLKRVSLLPKSETTSKQLLDKILDVEKLKYCFDCGICTASCPVVELIPDHYHPRSLLERLSRNLDDVVKEDQLWLCAWCYRCHRRCPQELKVPEILLFLKDLAAKRGQLDGFRKALEIIKKEIPLPAISCWVCFHHDRGEIDKPEVVKTVKRFVADYRTEGEAPETSRRHRDKIAIIGSGPAGLTAATELVKRGYAVTIFESASEPGGMLRACMPKYRLPEGVLDAEIKHLKSLGVQIRTNTTIGKELTLDSLLQNGYKAVFIATGAHKSRRLNIEGVSLEGVADALDFLRQVNSGKKPQLGNRVAVIGGGNVGVDAARTALRLGAKDVSILYRRSREEMPANPWEVTEAEKGGVKLHFLVAPKRIIGKNGRVSALECIRVKLGELDETGRKRPVPIEGSEFQIELDAVILAIGETSDVSFLPMEIEVTEENTIAVDPFTLETSKPGVFAGGDAVLGPATVIEAIVAGKRAVASIDHHVKSRNVKVGSKMRVAEEAHAG